MEKKLRQIETGKKVKKPYTGNSRASFFRKKKELIIETKKKQEIVALKEEKKTEFMSLGLDKDQAQSLAVYTVDNNEQTLAQLITTALISKYKARTELDNMVISGNIKPLCGEDWAYMRKALE